MPSRFTGTGWWLRLSQHSSKTRKWTTGRRVPPHVVSARRCTTMLQSWSAPMACPKIILDAVLVAGATPQFPGLHVYLTWILSIGERNCGLEINEFKVIHPESSNASEFLFHVGLTCVSVNSEAASATSGKKVKKKKKKNTSTTFNYLYVNKKACKIWHVITRYPVHVNSNSCWRAGEFDNRCFKNHSFSDSYRF
jgi:hypothetical protein